MPLIASETETRAWLTLSLTVGVGDSTLRHLLQAFGMPEQVLDAGAAALGRVVDARIAQALCADDAHRANEVAAALDWLAQDDNFLISVADPHYPKDLLESPDPPMLLYCKGNLARFEHPAVAVVGSRNATAQGLANAEQFAHALSDAGVVVVSGLALGIDAAAHRGALAGHAGTIAVVGTGLDIVYPSKNRNLAHQIAAQGSLMVSEFALGTRANAGHFPRRNRIIAGLSRGTLVVEAAVQSGSLITARLAGEIGREVLAIPGSIHSPQSRGCHALIKQGAKLVESAGDVLEELRLDTVIGTAPVADAAADSDPTDPVLQALAGDPVDLDTLAQRTGLAMSELIARLTELELAGNAAPIAGGRWQAISRR
jgi:DNA processing protein